MARFVSVTGCMGLAFVVACTLSGCLGPMVAGYPNGTEKEPIEVLAVKPATPTRPAQQLLVQKTHHTARILASPDGGRDKHPLFASYTYSLKTGDAPAQELGFLRVGNDMIGGRLWLEKVFPIPNTDEWIGLRSDYPEDNKRLTEVELKRKYRFPPRQYAAVVFNAQRIVRQHEFVCVADEVEFNLPGGAPSLRLLRDDGWWLLDLATGRIAPEPNRPREARPDNHHITLPGASWRIAMEAPAFVEIEETLGDRYYSVYAHTKWQSDGGPRFVARGPDDDDLAVSISIGLKPREGLTREKFLSDWFKSETPPNLRQAADYDRIESVDADSFVKQVEYFSVVHGRTVIIRLRFRPPYGRWNEAIARIDETLRFEDAPRETAAAK